MRRSADTAIPGLLFSTFAATALSDQRRTGWAPYQFLLVFLITSSQAAPLPTEAPPLLFRVALSSSCFRNVNRTDALSAYRLFLENTGREMGTPIKPEIVTFHDASTFAGVLRPPTTHLVVLDSWQYLAFGVCPQLKPFFVAAERGHVGRKHLMLTRGNSAFRTLADLRGQKILQLKQSNINVPRVWLNSLLLAGGLGSQETFFGGVDVVEKPMAAVLPVYFGKYAACLVDEPCFNVMTEMNPQVGKTLTAVAVSDVFVDIILCLNESGWPSPQTKADTIRALEEQHLRPTGKS